MHHQCELQSATYLAGYSVGLTDLVTPVTSSYWDHGKLCQDNGPSNGCCHFFGTLHTKTHVSIVVSNSDKSLEKGISQIKISPIKSLT